jgi:uncharacterized protein (TIGR03790 family)
MLVSLVGVVAAGQQVFAQGVPLNERVLVVYNSNVPESVEVANHYATRRQIPPSNRCAIAPPATGFVTWNDYLSTVRAPLRSCLDAVGRDRILYIVFTYQTPFEIDQVPVANGMNLRSLDQYVADIWNEHTPGNEGVFINHPYFAPAQSQGNSYQRFVSLADYRASAGAKRIYSVWRLDAASVALSKGLVDKALQAEAEGLSGQGCFDRNRGSIFNQPDSSYSAAEWDLHRAAGFASQAGFASVEDENLEEFGTAPAPARCDNAALYSGWYSYNNYNDAFTWSVGAIGFHLDSASAIHPREGTNWSANALTRGITATSGSITEPYLEGLAHPDGVFRNLFEGANVGDAFLRNTAYLKWVVLNMGDPLYRPFPGGRAPFNSPAYTPASLSLSPDFVVGGRTSVGTITLDAPAPAGGAVITFTTSNSGVASAPDPVAVPAGATSATFNVTTHTVVSYLPAIITAFYPGGDISSTLLVAPLLNSVELNPRSVTGGATSTGRVWLNDTAPAGGALITLSSQNPSVAAVPASILVPEGQTSATFNVTTNSVASNTGVQISASYNGVTEVAVLTVMPGTAPPPTPTPTPTPASTSAVYVRTDTTTQGNWRGVYGSDGYEVVNDAINYPAYAQVSSTGANPYTWTPSSSDLRALERASSSGRIASAWYNWTEMTFDINLTDGQEHQLALYCLDWETAGRALSFEVRDATTGALLDSRSLSQFAQGKYAVWNLKGHVRIRVVSTGAANAVISGLFFAQANAPAPTPTPTPSPTPPPPTPTPTPTPTNGGTSAAYVRTDTTTQGNWRGVYGSEGYEVVNDAINYPAYAQISSTGANPYTWTASTSEARALQRASTGGRIASAWYNWTEMTFDINLTDGQEHELALYCLDWEAAGRVLSFEVVNTATGAVLDSRSVSDFAQGKYAVWNLKGHVRIRVVSTGAANAVVSGLFFAPGAPPNPNPPPTPTPTPSPTPPPPPGSTSAAYVRTDITTQGNWRGVYGSDGYEIVNDAVSYPAYAQIGLTGANPYTWTPSTTDLRALERAAGGGRIASAWYNWTEMTFDINLTDGQEHQLALYCLDWETAGRALSFEVKDATTGALLDSRNLSDFAQGKYVVWKLKGHLRIRVLSVGAANAVVSGLFFAPSQ